jgi:Fic family protein
MHRSGTYIKQITGYRAFIPAPLPPKPPVKIEGTLHNLLSRADMALARLDGLAEMLPNVDLFIAMYVRKEALLSSQIEGTQASLDDLFAFESGKKLENVNDIKEVVNYVKALDYGIDRLQTLPMSLRIIKEIHAILLEGVRGSDRSPGEFKKSQNWIGPPGCTLNEATFVPPPPYETSEAMGNLEQYIHKKVELPVLIDCALIHYQFETIHPFLDGNGRVGRLLITFYLYWKDVLHKPLLYLSYYFKKNRQEYYDRLNMVRNTGNYEQWIDFFLKGITDTATSAMNTARKILELQTKHRRLLWEKRISSSIAVGILEHLFYTPVVSTGQLAKKFDISYQAASTIVSQMEKAGILKETTGRKRDKRFVYSDYLNILAEGTKI